MLGDSYFDDEPQSITKALKKAKKPKKLKYQDQMVSLPKSCFSCATHPDQYLRKVQQMPKNPPLCKSCGFKCVGNKCYLVCSKSPNCFFLCSSCKVCTANHPLRKMKTLRHRVENALFAEDKFQCHGCKETKTVGESGQVYHCYACQFSICAECVEKTDRLWRDDEEEEEM